MSKIRIIHAGIANSAHQRRCASCSTERLPSSAENVESAKSPLPSAVKSFLTTWSREEWEQRDETIIRTTSRPCISDAMEKKDRKELGYQTSDSSVSTHKTCTNAALRMEISGRWKRRRVLLVLRALFQREAHGFQMRDVTIHLQDLVSLVGIYT